MDVCDRHCHVCLVLGIVKTHIPQSAFIDCAKQKRPCNSLFLDIGDVQNINMDDLETFLGLVKAMFVFEPLGPSAFINMWSMHCMCALCSR